MKLLALSIDGFRGIQHAIIRFGEHDVIVGPNGSGKSTIIDALSLVFGRTRLVQNLTEHDFYGSCPEATSRIRIVATLGGFAGNDPDQHDGWFREGRAVPILSGDFGSDPRLPIGGDYIHSSAVTAAGRQREQCDAQALPRRSAPSH